MRKLLYIIAILSSNLLLAQEVTVSFVPVVDGDSLRVSVIANGDNSVELGSSNFVYTIEGEALDLTKSVAFIPGFSNDSYSLWMYVHNDEFEHILLSRTNNPKELVKISKVLVGEVAYPIIDKCQPVSIQWNTIKGDIRSRRTSIKEAISFHDTIIQLVKPIVVPEIIESEELQTLEIENTEGHTVKWYRDEIFISETNKISASQTGEYFASIYNGCETKLTKNHRVDRVTAQEKVIVKQETKLYPNPVMDKAMLTIDNSKWINLQRVVLVNEVGQELRDLTSKVTNSSTSLKVSEWNIPKGVYCIKLVYQDDSEILRFIY